MHSLAWYSIPAMDRMATTREGIADMFVRGHAAGVQSSGRHADRIFRMDGQALNVPWQYFLPVTGFGAASALRSAPIPPALADSAVNSHLVLAAGAAGAADAAGAAVADGAAGAAGAAVGTGASGADGDAEDRDPRLQGSGCSFQVRAI